MHVFNINVSNKDVVKTHPPKYHVPQFSTDDFIFTMDNKSQEAYDIADIGLKTGPFSQRRINKKTIWVHDDNIKGNKKDYKYKVKVKPINGDPVLEEDPTIVNQ